MDTPETAKLDIPNLLIMLGRIDSKIDMCLAQLSRTEGEIKELEQRMLNLDEDRRRDISTLRDRTVKLEKVQSKNAGVFSILGALSAFVGMALLEVALKFM